MLWRWRRGWDSNPRTGRPAIRVAAGPLRPLGHRVIEPRTGLEPATFTLRTWRSDQLIYRGIRWADRGVTIPPFPGPQPGVLPLNYGQHGRDGRARTGGLVPPRHARFLLRHIPLMRTALRGPGRTRTCGDRFRSRRLQRRAIATMRPAQGALPLMVFCTPYERKTHVH